MKKKSKSNRTLYFQERTPEKRETFSETAERFLFLLPLYLGMFLSLIHGLGLMEGTWLGAVWGAVFLLLFNLPFRGRRWAGRVLAASALLLAVLLLSGFYYAEQGLLLLVNQVLTKAAGFLEAFPSLYETQAAGGEALVCLILLLSFAGSLLALLIGTGVRRRGAAVLTVFLALLLLGTGAAGGRTGDCLLLAGGLLLFGMQQFWTGSRRGATPGGEKKRARLQSGAIFLVFFALAAVLAGSFSGISREENLLARAGDRILEGVQRLRFEKAPVDSLPEGKLVGLGERRAEKETALEVLMETPQSLYLRGFVGSRYTGKGWEELEPERYLKEQALFYWLHEKGFYGMQQLGLLHSLLEGEARKSKVTVQNVHADSRYFYLPYEWNGPVREIGKSRTLGDVNARTKGVFGQRVYQFHTDDNQVRQYPALAAGFYQRKAEAGLEEYTQAESYYNAFVYETYLEISTDAETVLQAQLGRQRAGRESRCSYEEANTIVMGYLDEHLTYEEETAVYTGETDFLKWLLESQARGYDVHYAAAAAVMYRFLGIPARYVEGYLLTPDLVSGAGSNEKIQVTGEEAHAWVEIYQDGVGWIPMEVTPNYRDVMERPEYALAPEKGSAQEESGSSQGSAEQIQEETEPRKKETNSRKEFSVRNVLVWSFLAAAVLLLLLLAGYLARGRRRVRLRQKSFQDEDARRAVGSLYAYMLLLLRYEKIPCPGGSHASFLPGIKERYGEAAAARHESVLAVVQECLYSLHPIRPEQRVQVETCQRELLADILKGKKFWGRFLMKWKDFLY